MWLEWRLDEMLEVRPQQGSEYLAASSLSRKLNSEVSPRVYSDKWSHLLAAGVEASARIDDSLPVIARERERERPCVT